MAGLSNGVKLKSPSGDEIRATEGTQRGRWF
jgi:hypothetical protein